MEEEEFERRWKCKRQLEGAEGEGGKRGWVEDEEEEAEQKLSQERSQVQEEEAAGERNLVVEEHHWGVGGCAGS